MTERRSHIDDKIAAMLAQSQAAAQKRRVPSGYGGCSNKDAYASEAKARAIALMNGTAERLSIYRCDECDQWHFTKRRQP